MSNTVSFTFSEYAGIMVYSAGTSTDFTVGRMSTGRPTNMVLRPDFSSIENNTKATVLSATYYIYMDANVGTSQVLELRNFYVKRDWVAEDVTRDEYSDGNSWQTVGGIGENDIDTSNLGGVGLNLTESVGWKSWAFNASGISYLQQIIRGDVTNNGFMLRNPYNPYGDQKSFRAPGEANEPYISIVYTYGSSTQPIFMD